MAVSIRPKRVYLCRPKVVRLETDQRLHMYTFVLKSIIGVMKSVKFDDDHA